MTHSWPDAKDLLVLLAGSTGPHTTVRDGGILFAAAARPHAVLLDGHIYPTALEQAAALLYGITSWRPLELWNAGLAWTAADVRLERAGLWVSMPVKERMTLTDELTSGVLDSVNEIVLRLAPYLEILDQEE
jgi:death-on-curing protein